MVLKSSLWRTPEPTDLIFPKWYYGVHVKNSLNAAAINVVRSGKDVMAEEEE
jgi:hypothetical protein